MSETPPAQDDIQHMLREAQHGSEITDEFARVCLRLFHRACQEVVTWHRTLGRRYFLEGHEPEALKRIVDQDIEQIAGILDWLKQPRGGTASCRTRTLTESGRSVATATGSAISRWSTCATTPGCQWVTRTAC